jgi:hypothetical protein
VKDRARKLVGRGVFPGVQAAGALGLLLLLLVGSAGAQVSTASINGVIRDPNGAVISGATILLKNTATSVEHTSTSNNAGEYVFLNIVPGTYTIEASANGFNPERLAPFILAVDQVATFDFSLKIGTSTQVVTVEAAAAQLDVTTASLGTVIPTKQVNDLPLNGRNFTALLELTPGVAPINVGQNGSNLVGTGGFGAAIGIGADFIFPAINGQSGRSDYFLMDGLPDYAAINSTYAIAPIVDAIQEFKVVSHPDDAEFGSVLGGVVNVVTKSGTNELHGAAWEYLRNTAFDARPYFLPTTEAKPFYHQNQFGGAIGGPVVIPKLYNGKNRTFFFGSYQGLRYSKADDNDILVPTAAELAGNEADNGQAPIYDPFSTVVTPTGYSRTPFPGNQIPANRIDQRMVAYAKYVYPTAGPFFNPRGDGSFASNAIDTTPEIQSFNEFSVRLDQTVGPKDSAWFRYSFSDMTLTLSGGLPTLPSSLVINSRNLGGSWVHVFSPTRILQGQYSYTTVLDNGITNFSAPSAGVLSAAGFASSFVSGYTDGISGGNVVPELSINGLAGGGTYINLTPKATDNQGFQGSFTQIIRNHEIKFGLGWVTTGFSSIIADAGLTYAAPQTSGLQFPNAVTGDPLSSFLLNVPQGATRRNVDETERPGGVLSAYLQDSWKALPKLTLNYGLRYDYSFLPIYGTAATVGKNGGPETGDMDFSTGNYIVQQLPPPCTVRGHAPCIPGNGTLPANVVVSPNGKISHNTHTNFGPRVGFAYKLDDNTAVHGAFGIFFENWAAVTQMTQNIEGAWPDIGQQTLTSATNEPTNGSPLPTVNSQDPFGSGSSSLFPPATPFASNDWFYDPNYKNAYSEQWNFGVQRQLGNATALKVDYVGSGSHRTNIGGEYNTARYPGPGDPQARAPFPYSIPMIWDRSFGIANYNALQVALDKRLTHGLTFQVAYTWSKAETSDDGWFASEGQVVQDPYDPGASRGLAGTNVPNMLSVNSLWDIPVGPGKQFSTGNRFADYVLGNWQINNIFTARNGQNFTIIDSADIANIGNTGYERGNQVGNPWAGHVHTVGQWFNTSAFAVPQQYTYGNAYRGNLQDQRWFNFDTSVIRSFPIWRETQFQFRAEAFNLFNHPIFGTPGNDLNNPAAFGAIGSAQANTNRLLQVSGKFVF